MKIIGIHGKKRSGKDSLWVYLKKNAPNAVRLAFADALKEEVAETCGVPVEYIEDHKDNFRLILQGWGTDFRRKLFGDRYWINKTLKVMQELFTSGHELIIIPDVRFMNEYEFVKKNGGFMVHIMRNTPAIDTHESERTLQAKFDFNIDNNSDFNFLDEASQQILKLYL